MVVRPKFDPQTPKVAMCCFTFNSVKFKVGDDFNRKTAKASDRQIRQMYNARRLKDKYAKGTKQVPKVPKLTEAQEFAKAKAEQLAIDRGMVTTSLDKAKASILQQVSNVEAEEAYDAKEASDKANAKVAKAKAKAKAAKAKKAKAGTKEPAASETKEPVASKTNPWD